MQVNLKKLSDTEVEIEVELPKEAFEKYRAPALTHLIEHLDLPGFRKGHVPENVARERLGPMAILEEMAQRAISAVYPKLINEHKLDAIDRPRVTITRIAEGSPLCFRIHQTVLPEVKLPDYKKIASEVKEEDKSKRPAAIVDAILKETQISLPPILIERELETMVEDIKKRYGSKQSDVELRAELRPITEGRVRVGILLESIAKAENLAPDKVLAFLEKL